MSKLEYSVEYHAEALVMRIYDENKILVGTVEVERPSGHQSTDEEIAQLVAELLAQIREWRKNLKVN
jgi:hypothetical protein